MDEHIEIGELREIYQEMDPGGREKMAAAAAQLLKVQKSFEDNPNAVKPRDRFLREERQNAAN